MLLSLILPMAGERQSFGPGAGVHSWLTFSTLKILVLGDRLLGIEQLAVSLLREEPETFGAKPAVVLMVLLLPQKVGRTGFSVFLKIAQNMARNPCLETSSHKIQRLLYP